MDKENAACNFRDERLKKRFRLLLHLNAGSEGMRPFHYYNNSLDSSR
jgi:hypothetical protein